MDMCPRSRSISIVVVVIIEMSSLPCNHSLSLSTSSELKDVGLTEIRCVLGELSHGTLLDEMMGFLLQHFLNYHFIRPEHLLEWYEQDSNHDIGYERARIWAIPTIQSLPRMESGEEQLMDDGYVTRKCCRRSRARSGDEPLQKRKPRRQRGKRRKTAAVSC